MVKKRNIYKSRNGKFMNDNVALFKCGHSMHQSCFKSHFHKTNICLTENCNTPLEFIGYANNKISNKLVLMELQNRNFPRENFFKFYFILETYLS